MSLRRASGPLVLPGLLTLLAAVGAEAAPVRVNDVRLWSGPEGTRLVLDLSAPVKHDVFTLNNPYRVVIDLANASIADSVHLPAGQGPVTRIRSGKQPRQGLRLVLDLAALQQPRSFTVAPDGSAGHRLVVELPVDSATAGTRGASVPAQPQPVATIVPAAATPTAAAPTHVEGMNAVKSLATGAQGRDLVIAVDAGHGGKDPGAIGRSGTQEKRITLAIARKLAAAIDREDGMRAVLVRDDDRFISLRGRILKARDYKADMFVSIHADSVRDRGIGGSSVYVLSLRGASDEAARWLAERENAADLIGGVSLDDKNDVLASVLLDVTQKESVSNSVDAAASVLASLRGVTEVHRPRVQHAGFVVLKSPDIPSMLVETAFISNSTDERRLKDPVHQQRVADAIHAGVRNYFHARPPPGTRVAALVAATRAGEPRTLAGR
jgi:N-acetylmuramoyl-L-alanine amidase